MGLSNPDDAAGLNNLLVENNIIDNWYRGIYVESGFTPGANGPLGFNDVQIRQNDFQHVTGPVLTHSDPLYKTQEHWSADRYSADSNSLQVNQKTMSLSQWHGSDEPTAIVADVAYTDPNAGIAAYNAAAGAQATIDDFLAQERQQSSQNWRPQYDVQTFISYFRNAYAEVGAAPRNIAHTHASHCNCRIPPTVLDNDGSMTFSVTYQDLKALNLSSVASGNVNVTGKGGLNVPATLIDVNGSGPVATATYSIAVPAKYFRKGRPQKLTVMMNGHR